MTPLFLARRRAERFDSLVEGGRRDDVDRATTELLELVGALRTVPEARPRPEFVADLRERLMLAAETELVPAATTPARDDVARLTITPTRTRRERRIGVALGAVAIMGATASVAAASQGALPGDALYPVKRAIENTQAGFRVSDDSKGESILGNASTRLDEVDKLTQQQQPDAQLVTQTLNTFADQATDAGHHLMSGYAQNGDPQSIKDLHQFAHQSIDALNGLEAVIPPQARPALLAAASAVDVLDHEATNLCPGTECGNPLTELPADIAAGGPLAQGAATSNEAGGQLTGTPTAAAGPQNGGKGDGHVSGLNPPETPIQLPSASAGTTPGAGGILPTAGPTAGGTPASGGPTAPSGHGHGGHGGKNAPVDLAPVTDTVNQVVTGAVQGVNGLLNGLTGGASATP